LKLSMVLPQSRSDLKKTIRNIVKLCGPTVADQLGKR
jgi:hypothetical protein